MIKLLSLSFVSDSVTVGVKPDNEALYILGSKGIMSRRS